MDILKSLGHPEEIYNLFKFKMGGCRTVMPKLDYVSNLFFSRMYIYRQVPLSILRQIEILSCIL